MTVWLWRHDRIICVCTHVISGEQKQIRGNTSILLFDSVDTFHHTSRYGIMAHQCDGLRHGKTPFYP